MFVLLYNVYWLLGNCGTASLFYKPIRYELLPRLGSFKAFGVEATFIEVEIKKSAEKWMLEISGYDCSLVMRRAQRLAPILQGAQILWVDDKPETVNDERIILNALGIVVDKVKTADDGIDMLSSRTKYNLVISTIKHDGVKHNLLDRMIKCGYDYKVIYYIGDIDKKRGVPPHAFGITDRPDHLLHLVFDVLARERS